MGVGQVQGAILQKILKGGSPDTFPHPPLLQNATVATPEPRLTHHKNPRIEDSFIGSVDVSMTRE